MGKKKHKHHHQQKEVVCPPQYVVHDYCTPRVVRHVHPIVNIYRENIVYVPEHVYKPTSKKVVNDPGYRPFCC